MDTTISLAEAQDKLAELAERVEGGETIVVTQNGKPVFDLVPHKRKGGINWAALDEYEKKHGSLPVTWIADDFDDPLPEDFLLQPLPPDARKL